MANLGELNVVIGASIDKFEAAMLEVEQGIGRAGKAAQEAGAGLTAGITLPLGLLAGVSLKAAGDIQKTEAALTTMLGSADAAKKTLADLTTFAANTPFELPEIREAAQKLLAFNTPAKDLQETLRQLGDIASGVGAPIGELSELYGKAQVQGRLFADDVNQLTGRGIPVIQEFAKQFGVTDDKVKGLVESGKIGFPELQKAFTSLTSEGGKFSGLMEAQSKTLPGLFSNLSDTIGQAAGKLGLDIAEALDLGTVIPAISQQISELAQSFSSLSPEVKKAIVITAGLAAVVGPALGILGALASALPVAAAGFALISGPVGLAVAALVALTAATVAYLATNKSAGQAYSDQKQKVQALEKSLNPLLARYDELKGKTTLNKDEQAELKNVIGQLAGAVPGAVSALDKYGNAVDVNREKIKQLIDNQKAFLRATQGPAVEENRKRFAEATQLLTELERKQDQFNKKGFFINGPALSKSFDSEAGGPFDNIFPGSAAFARFQKSLGDTRLLVSGLKEEYARLTGANLTNTTATDAGTAAAGRSIKALGLLAALQEKLKAAQERKPTLTTEAEITAINKQIAGYEEQIKKLNELGVGNNKAAETLAELRKELVLNTQFEKVLGETYDEVAQRQGILENGVKKLTEAFGAGSPITKQYLKDLRDTEAQIAAGDFEPLAPRIPALDTSALERSITDLPKKLEPTKEALLVQGNELGAAFAQGIGSAAADITASLFDNLAQTIAGGGSFSEGLEAAFNDALSIVGQFASDFGRQMIALGVAKTLADTFKFAPGPAMIAAGVGLLAAGALVGASTSRGPFGGGGGGRAASTATAVPPRPSFAFQPARGSESSMGGGVQNNTLRIEMVAAGRDLLAVANVERDRLGRVIRVR